MTEWKLADVSTVIVGAGFSAAATDGRMPLMGNFFDRLDGEQSPLLREFVCSVSCDPRTANIESVLVSLEQIRTAPAVALKGWAEKWKTELPQLRQELEQYVLDRIKAGLELEDDNWALNLLAGCGVNTSVISMNYDNIAERVLSCVAHTSKPRRPCAHCKMIALLQKSCNCEARRVMEDRDWRGALMKPHGSIAWKRCKNSDCCSFECLVADCDCLPIEASKCPQCCEPRSPAIVMPTMSKHLDDLPEIGVMWQATRSAIAAAESVLIFGFSMPASDELLAHMIRATIHQSRKLRRVAVIDLDPDGVLKRFERCLPEDQSIEATLFKVTPGVRPDWLHDDSILLNSRS